MISFLIILSSFALLGANALSSEEVDRIVQETMQVGQNCAVEVKATSEDMAELLAYKIPPSTHEGKCVLACFYKHYKIMREDGTFDKETSITLFNKIKESDPPLHEKIMKIIEACEPKEKTFDDPCEAASSVASCVLTQAHAMGLNNREAFLA